MRAGVRPWLLPVVLAGVLWLAACGESTPQLSPSPTSRQGELPPAWVQNEVAWQSLNNGEATRRSASGRWPSRLAPLLSTVTPPRTSSPTPTARHGLHRHSARPLHVARQPREELHHHVLRYPREPGGYVASGLEPAAHKLNLLPAMHSYVPPCPSLRACGATPASRRCLPRRPVPAEPRPGGGLRWLQGRRSAAHDGALGRGRLLHPRSPARCVHPRADRPEPWPRAPDT